MKIPLGLGGLRMSIDFEKTEEREPEFARCGEGQRRRRDHEHGPRSISPRDGGGTEMRWEADVKIAGPVGSMGQRVLQPMVNQQVARSDGLGQVQRRRGGRRRGALDANVSPSAADPTGV